MVAPVLLALVASSGPSPWQVDELAACPLAPVALHDPEERIMAEQARASCLERAQREAASHLPPGLRASWDAEQETFDRWAAKACALTSELYGLDLDQRRLRRSTETIVAERRCLQNAYGERAYLAKSLATFDPSDPSAPAAKHPFLALVLDRKQLGAKSRQRLAKVLAVAREAPQVPGGLGHADWESLAGTIDHVSQETLELALRGCERRKVTSLCLARMEAYYFSLVNPFENGKGG
jgi:hypothetical protein